MNDANKLQLVSSLAEGEIPVPSGRAKFRVSAGIVHVRFCSTSDNKPNQYKFNINKNTLSSDFELWICGSKNNWYLLPISFIKTLHEHPEAYEDHQHPGLTVVSVNTENNEVMYARGGLTENISKYYAAVFSQLA